ncbi:3070_t:CDS:2 [Funneliformis mosseae]|uniref:3070_t:CDS:1 n=1 Tax=Funneliformis mosseae TaxID=27381 RepID=A0A9N9B709_FUNMO|nr:3070_t:CDS:2 [Funneliformis mosseae]
MTDNISNSSSDNIDEFFDPTLLSDKDKTISDISIENQITAVFRPNLKIWDIEYFFEFKEYPKVLKLE